MQKVRAAERPAVDRRALHLKVMYESAFGHAAGQAILPTSFDPCPVCGKTDGSKACAVCRVSLHQACEERLASHYKKPVAFGDRHVVQLPRVFFEKAMCALCKQLPSFEAV